MIYLTGDTHGKLERLSKSSMRKKFGKPIEKDDVAIILGDFGCLWSKKYTGRPYVKEKRYLDEFSKNLAGELLIVLGNHENYDIIEKLPTEERYGGKVYKVRDNIYILKNGESFTIQDKTFFVFGGADSIDKFNRVEGISWWPQELSNKKEMDHGIETIEDNMCRFNYILSHQMPQQMLEAMLPWSERQWIELNCPVMKYLTHIHEMIDFYHWYCGHWHFNKTVGKYTCLYEKVIELK